jgi:hypothetical protein
MSAHFFPKKNDLIAFLSSLAKVNFSVHFYDMLDRKVTTLIKQGTGLSPSPQITIGISMTNGVRYYEPSAETSRLSFTLGIANTVGHDISFCWRSKSGKFISISDENFDEDDLECWMEGLTPEKYYEDLARLTNKRPPFKVKNLPFELEIRDYAYEMNIYVTLNKQGLFDHINGDLDNIIVKFNDLAHARDIGQAKGPVLQGVHNWKITLEEDGRILIYIDAASPDILKKLMMGLAKHEEVTKVEMDLVS